nr:sigma-70 family RNA polymerase sigma factor [Caldimonas mangrovi]
MSLRKRLLGIAGRVLGVPAEAEEVVQEAYLRFHREAAGGLVSAEAWLVTVVTRLAIDRRRERLAFGRALEAMDTARLLWPQPTLPSTRGEPDVGPQVVVSEEARAEHRAEVNRALQALQRSLPMHEALVLLLHDVFEADYRDLAQWLGKSEEACRQLVHRARSKLLQRRPKDGAGEAADAGRNEVKRWLQALLDRDHRSLVAALLRCTGRPQPALLASRTETTVSIGYDRQGRLSLKLGPHLLCALPVAACDAAQCCG